jgi:hypothetical protein
LLDPCTGLPDLRGAGRILRGQVEQLERLRSTDVRLQHLQGLADVDHRSRNRRSRVGIEQCQGAKEPRSQEAKEPRSQGAPRRFRLPRRCTFAGRSRNVMKSTNPLPGMALAPAWKRADIEYFSPDRLEAYPTLRRGLVAGGYEKVLSGAVESSLDTPGSNVGWASSLSLGCVLWRPFSTSNPGGPGVFPRTHIHVPCEVGRSLVPPEKRPRTKDDWEFREASHPRRI